jgi:hypothetical protein
MFNSKLLTLAALLSALTLGGCASTRAPGVTSDQPTYVAAVEVVQQDNSASTAFADTLHEAVVKGAALYGTTGAPITLKIEVDKVHFKNPLKAMVIGDNNLAKGRVAVFDQTSGQQLGTFKVEVDAERPSAAGAGAGIALFLGEVLDPTGGLAIAHMAGNAASADINRGGTTAAMSANFAAETLRQTFGDAKTRAAKLAQRN